MTMQVADYEYYQKGGKALKNIKYYKVSIKFKEKILSDNINLSKLEEDLLQAKEEFNAHKEKQIAILRPHSRRINILVRSSEDFNLNSISNFLDILVKEMNWIKYSVQSSESFELVFSQEITKEDCANYVRGHAHRDNQCIDKIVVSKWIELDNYEFDIEDDDLDREHYHKRNRRSRRLTKEELKNKVNQLISQEELKKELIGWINLNSQIKEEEIDRDNENRITYNYIFTASPGSGITTALYLMSEVFYNLNLIPRQGCNESVIGQKIKMPLFFFRDDYGIVNGLIVNDYPSVENLDSKKYDKNNNLNVFIVDPKNKDYSKIIEKINSLYICKNIRLKDFTQNELIQMLENNLKNYGLQLSDKAKKQCNKFISNKGLENVNAKYIQKMSSQIIMCEIGNLKSDEKFIIKSIDFNNIHINEKKIDEVILEEIKGKDELNKLIGLDEIKKQVEDIINQLFINRRKQEEGLMDKCEIGTMHMCFYGNPGTGKTTVARIIGKILKEVGILEKGEFFEVGREDLVAQYVGHTAMKTSEVLNKALDSVLFIDEAYSLNSGSKQDFGREAIDTIVRHMENYRDRSVIIFAGYKNEMDELFGMNPGLKSRISYKIEFQDYSEEEMLSIFKLMTKDKYSFDEKVESELLNLFEKAKKYYSEDFSNGRFVRNIYERIMMKQGSRLVNENKLDRESLMEIRIEDVLSIYEDDEYKRIIDMEEKKKKSFGFTA